MNREQAQFAAAIAAAEKVVAGAAGRKMSNDERDRVKQHIDTYERRQALWEGVLEGCVPALVASEQQARADVVMHEYLRRAAQPTNAAARCVVREDRQDVCRACKGV